MAFAPPDKNKQPTTNIAKSTWTPMNNTGANSQVFEERRTIIKKWFEKWHEKQRRIVIEDIFKSLSEKHLLAVHNSLMRQFPEEKHDFTKRLPRVLSLYVFSFLDPRSLCRCAQVSWYWKYLTELDCIWRPKCLRFGWYPTHQPTQYEETIWKRHYLTTIHQLHYAKAKDEPKHEQILIQPDTARTDRSHLSSARSHMSSASTSRRKKASVAPRSVPIPGPSWEPPPWKGSDPHPTDTMRYNYLDNAQKKNKNKNPRPKSASGSVVTSARKSVHSPLKSNMEPRSSSGVPHNKNFVVTQSLDPQALKTAGHDDTNGKIQTATSRNVMSASVSNFTYTGSPDLHGSINGGATLQASTYYVNLSSPMQHGMVGTLNNSYYTSGLHGQSPVLSPSSPQQSQAIPDLSRLTMKDATIRPKPVTKLSTEKSLTSSVEKQKALEPDLNHTLSVKKPVVTKSDYQVKETQKNGKATPLQGNPWKTKEVVSDDSDF